MGLPLLEELQAEIDTDGKVGQRPIVLSYEFNLDLSDEVLYLRRAAHKTVKYFIELYKNQPGLTATYSMTSDNESNANRMLVIL